MNSFLKIMLPFWPWDIAVQIIKDKQRRTNKTQHIYVFIFFGIYFILNINFCSFHKCQIYFNIIF